MAEQSVVVAPFGHLSVTSEQFPWINQGTAEVSAVTLTLEDEARVAYGSMVGLSGSLAKLANKVSDPDSQSLQGILFQGLPSVLKGLPHPGISRVENSQHLDARLFIATRNLRRMPSLVFAVEPRPEGMSLPVVLKVGVSPAGEQDRLLGLLGLSVVRNKRRRNS